MNLPLSHLIVMGLNYYNMAPSQTVTNFSTTMSLLDELNTKTCYLIGVVTLCYILPCLEVGIRFSCTLSIEKGHFEADIYYRIGLV